MIPSSPPLKNKIGSFAVKQRHSTMSVCPGSIMHEDTGLNLQEIRARLLVTAIISLLSGTNSKCLNVKDP
jgi:hypothetical protein